MLDQSAYLEAMIRAAEAVAGEYVSVRWGDCQHKEAGRALGLATGTGNWRGPQIELQPGLVHNPAQLLYVFTHELAHVIHMAQGHKLDGWGERFYPLTELKADALGAALRSWGIARAGTNDPYSVLVGLADFDAQREVIHLDAKGRELRVLDDGLRELRYQSQCSHLAKMRQELTRQQTYSRLAARVRKHGKLRV